MLIRVRIYKPHAATWTQEDSDSMRFEAGWDGMEILRRDVQGVLLG